MDTAQFKEENAMKVLVTSCAGYIGSVLTRQLLERGHAVRGLEAVFRVLPDLDARRVQYVHKVEDPRDYRVDFAKIHSALGYQISKRVPDGIREIAAALRSGIISEPDSARYRNI
jgi:nucleoside-diphosphate-sugar epimerase